MTDATEMGQLRARIDKLETENTALKRRESKGAAYRTRSVLAVLVLLIAALLAPAAVVSTWVRAELIDTDRFVSSLAPLAEKPAVQSFISDEVVRAIESNLDIEAVVHEAVVGLSSLDLPPQAATAFGLLEGPAVHGVQSILRTTVDQLVASPQFARVWETSLRQTHARAIAVIQGDPDGALQLSADGTLSIELGPVIAEVREQLVAQGVGLATLIPTIERSIPLVTSDALTGVRAGYMAAAAIGYWLPWVVLGLLIGGIALAHNRARATFGVGLGLSASLLLLLAGIGTGKLFFIATMSPAFMPAATAETLFSQVTLSVHAIAVALVVFSAIVAVAAWGFGRSRQARAIRTAVNRGFARARSGLDRVHLDTGRFGAWIDRVRPALWAIAVAVTVLVVFLNRPVTLAGVWGALAWFLVAVIAVELLRRPRSADPANSGAMQQFS
ncbi:hypothetical protein ACI1US_01370 [Leucobacter sp. BZR 635]